ncbi:MAG TPA: PilZ domain-containing protein [Thermoanaerobaculia bacterium]|jgi:hypothetical protein
MTSYASERRQYERLHLTEPLDAWFGDYLVRLIDVSTDGALIESEDDIAVGSRGLLRFFWDGEDIELVAEIARANEIRSGVQFVEECPSLRALIARSSEAVSRAIEANARGERADNLLADETLTAAWSVQGSGFVIWTYRDGAWKARRSLLADQPEDGFTVSASEPDEQVELLCRTYELGDGETRRMTQLLAAMSVGDGN